MLCHRLLDKKKKLKQLMSGLEKKFIPTITFGAAPAIGQLNDKGTIIIRAGITVERRFEFHTFIHKWLFISGYSYGVRVPPIRPFFFDPS